jgi:hypothetical protein
VKGVTTAKLKTAAFTQGAIPSFLDQAIQLSGAGPAYLIIGGFGRDLRKGTESV